MAKKKEEEKETTQQTEEISTGDYMGTREDDPNRLKKVESSSAWKQRDVFAYLIFVKESQMEYERRKKNGEDVPKKEQPPDMPNNIGDIEKYLKEESIDTRYEDARKRIFDDLPGYGSRYEKLLHKAEKIKEGK